MAGIALGVAFAAVAVIIIGATIRMTVLARAKEITIMRLVGATDMFIRLPFLLDGLVKGILGGLLALLLVWVANLVVSIAPTTDGKLLTVSRTAHHGTFTLFLARRFD
jgi:cell division transport system permease protein